MAKELPTEIQSHIMHASLTNGKIALSGSDMVDPEEGLVRGNSFLLQLECDSEEELRTLYSKLSSEGEPTFQTASQFWGAVYGQLVDKYGNNWMLNYQKAS